MLNNRFGRLGDDNFYKGSLNPESLIAAIAQFLRNDSNSDISFESMQEEKHYFALRNSLTLPISDSTPIKIDNFTEQVKIAIDDCFNGVIVRVGADSICCVLPDNIVFKIQITKL